MAARSKRLIALAALIVLGAAISVATWLTGTTTSTVGSEEPPARVRTSAPAHAPKRIISLVPSLTESLFAIGAGPQVVGVGSYDSFPPEVATLPRVGALLDPDTERILSLRPDMVMMYGTQSDLQTQLTRAGIRTFGYRHSGIPHVLQMLRNLGVATGHQAQAERVTAGLQRRLDAIANRVGSRRRPRTLLVFQRQPHALRQIYVSGGIGFLHDLLTTAGGTNVFADAQRESVQPSQETLIAAAPEVVIEIRGEGTIPPDEIEAERRTWNTLASLPAVRTRRVYLLVGNEFLVPGPRLAEAAEKLARVMHPDAFR